MSLQRRLPPLGHGGASLVAQKVKNPPAILETRVQSLDWEDPLEKGNGNPLQYSCLENIMDREAWQATVHGLTKSQRRLSDSHFGSYMSPQLLNSPSRLHIPGRCSGLCPLEFLKAVTVRMAVRVRILRKTEWEATASRCSL